MKRLLYTQLAYNAAYFSFEGGLTYEPAETRNLIDDPRLASAQTEAAALLRAQFPPTPH